MNIDDVTTQQLLQLAGQAAEADKLRVRVDELAIELHRAFEREVQANEEADRLRTIDVQKTQRVTDLEADLERSRDEAKRLRDERDGSVWLWIGEPEEDDLPSLACPILMRPDQVRRLVGRAEAAEAEVEIYKARSEKAEALEQAALKAARKAHEERSEDVRQLHANLERVTAERDRLSSSIHLAFRAIPLSRERWQMTCTGENIDIHVQAYVNEQAARVAELEAKNVELEHELRDTMRSAGATL